MLNLCGFSYPFAFSRARTTRRVRLSKNRVRREGEGAIEADISIAVRADCG